MTLSHTHLAPRVFPLPRMLIHVGSLLWFVGGASLTMKSGPFCRLPACVKSQGAKCNSIPSAYLIVTGQKRRSEVEVAVSPTGAGVFDLQCGHISSTEFGSTGLTSTGPCRRDREQVAPCRPCVLPSSSSGAQSSLETNPIHATRNRRL